MKTRKMKGGNYKYEDFHKWYNSKNNKKDYKSLLHDLWDEKYKKMNSRQKKVLSSYVKEDSYNSSKFNEIIYELFGVKMNSNNTRKVRVVNWG